MRHVVLGVCGSVAAYRACDLARELMRSGFTVRVCLTDSASKFVSPALFEALTGQPCLESVFDEPEAGRMAHIDWARQADLLVIAPATASILAKLAGGVADDMLTTIALAATCPVLIAPAMNPAMFSHEGTQSAINVLTSRGAVFVEPEEGAVACGEQGQGKFASVSRIVDEVVALSRHSELLKGKRVLITSGPTHEPIDSVRFLSNRSSGKMGAALARAAQRMGAEVTVVTGPGTAEFPAFVTKVSVRTAREMLDASLEFAATSDLIIGAAAVSDYRVENPSDTKLRRGDSMQLSLVPNPDIISELAKVASRKAQAKVVAFAAEPDGDLEYVRSKMTKKGVDAIAINNISDPSIGFGSDQNELTLLWPDGNTQTSGKQSKLLCALWLLECLSGD